MVKAININALLCNNLSKGQKIVLDTNVLLMQFYSSPLEKSNDYKKRYQDFINKCITNKVKLYTTELNIYEAFHIIDKINLSIYNNLNGKNMDIKGYHQIKAERKKVHNDMEMFYKCLKNCVCILPNNPIERSWIDEYILSDNSLDLYDYALIKISQENNIYNVLTNDSDFVSDFDLVEKFTIFSQNSNIFNKINSVS